MNIYVQILLRALLAIAVLLILARINGPKQISQLTFYDYVVGITAGSIAAELAINPDQDILMSLIGLVLFMLSSLVLSFITNKSLSMRRMFTGNPVILISDGRIQFDALKKAHFDIDDLMRELRTMGYFDISQVNYAILETNGNVSVMPKAADRPATTTELAIQVEEDSLPANVILDGEVLEGNLNTQGFDLEWLKDRLNEQKIKKLDDIALATVSDGKLSVYLKEETRTSRTELQ